MALLRLQSLNISFGDKPVLNSVDLRVNEHERIALVGRNGTGKSTLLKIVGGTIKPDAGEIIARQGLRIAYLQQDVPAEFDGSIYSVVAGGLSDAGQLLSDYQTESELLANGTGSLDKLSRLQSQLDACDGWALGQKVSETLSRMSLDPDIAFNTLSGGLKRRVLLARALLTEPDILLLDEPTNHLDITAIEWLEEHLMSLRCTLIFITHDRSFLRRLATRIIELDRGELTDWPGNFATYLTGKEAQLATEAKQNALFDKKLAQEEVWIRQGIKARRTRNEGRVRALKKLREERRQRIEVVGKAKLDINKANASGKIVIEAENVSFSFGDTPIIQRFNATIQRGDKVGVIGPNGVGKSTLIRLLLGQLTPDSGTIKTGTNLEVAYFDQLRGALNPALSAMENVGEGRDSVEINGQTKHIISYMQDLLFAPDRARAPITALSGGETNRLMLAKLFLKPSNMLVLDEPTNDLDVETLELLESLVTDYAGTTIIISHDREFIDNTVTGTLVFEGNCAVREYVGGYSDWLAQRPAVVDTQKNKTDTQNKTSQKQGVREPTHKTPDTPKVKKLSYKDQRDLEQLPEKIERMENKIDEIQTLMSQPDFYRSNNDTESIISESGRLQSELEALYKRWEELEG